MYFSRFLGIAPGGGKQAMFDSEWGERRGYAIVAANAQCPVLTVYTGKSSLYCFIIALFCTLIFHFSVTQIK